MAEPNKAGQWAGAIAGAVLIVTGLTQGFEGLRTKPYRDPANIPTVCYGETQLEMRVYSKDECGELLRDRMARDYAPKVLACVPAFEQRQRRHAFAAAIDASYNAGPAAFCRSPMAKAFNADNWKAGCNAFPGWYVTARVGGVPTKLPGLVRRRIAERDLCLKSAT